MASPPAAGPPLRARRRLAIALRAGDTFASIVASGRAYCRLARLRDPCALKSSILDRNILKIGEALAR